MRTTARQRPLLTPQPWPQPRPEAFATDHPYVRRYWSAVLGPGAVADLLRLATAAQRGRSLALPTHLSGLLQADLARRIEHTIEVKVTVPPLPDHYLARLHPRLRTELATGCCLEARGH